MDDLLELDRRVFGKMHPALLEGAHLAGLYPATHPSVRLREMEAFRLLKAHPEMTLSAQSALALYDAMTAGTICEGWGFRTCNCYVKHGDYLYIAPSGEQAPRLAEDLFHRYQELNDPGRVQMEEFSISSLSLSVFIPWRRAMGGSLLFWCSCFCDVQGFPVPPISHTILFRTAAITVVFNSIFRPCPACITVRNREIWPLLCGFARALWSSPSACWRKPVMGWFPLNSYEHRL